MNKKFLIIILAVIFIGAGLFLGKNFLFSANHNQGELRLKSNPTTSIFLNSENRGRTPFKGKFNPGDYEIKLIPENGEENISWQQTVKVIKGTQTYVNVELGKSDIDSSWEIVFLEKSSSKDTELTVFSETDASEVFLDGERKGTVPLSFQKIPAGNHELKLAAPGFAEKTVQIKIVPGYKMTVQSQLALLAGEKLPEKTSTASAETKPSNTRKATILETPTGWLRVRAEASTSAEELATVQPGQAFPLLEEKSGWLKIEYEKGKEGWISGRYAETTQ